MNITKRCTQNLISLANFLQPLRRINLNLSGILLTKLVLISIKLQNICSKISWSLTKDYYTKRDTLSFPDLLKSAPSDDNYEGVSYDRESLFISIPVHKTIDCILYKVSVKKVLKPFCKKSVFGKLSNKLTAECVFSASNTLINQIDGCPMGLQKSVVLSDIYVCKMKEDIVAPSKYIF